MAASALSVEDLRELVAALADALTSVAGELEGDTEPDYALHERLVEHAALVATFKRLPEGEVRGKLRSIYKEEEERVTDVDEPEAWRPDPEPVNEALERLRVARLRDPELHAALITLLSYG